MTGDQYSSGRSSVVPYRSPTSFVASVITHRRTEFLVMYADRMRLPSTKAAKRVAEAIETELERNALKQLGVDVMQGYFFARPAFRAITTAASAPWAVPARG